MDQPSTPIKRSRWQTSKSLARSAWNVLKLDRKLAGIPLLSAGITILLAIILGATILLIASTQETANGSVLPSIFTDVTWQTLVFYAGIYLLFTFITTYFSGALIAGLLQRFSGESPTMKSSLDAARAHIGSLLKFSLLTGTIGYLLQLLEEKMPLAGKIATWVLGAAWSIASMFAIPVIVSSKKKIGPFEATRESAGVIKKTWGETLVLDVGIGLVAILSMVVYFVTMAGIGALTAFILDTSGAGSLATGIGLGSVGFLGVVGLMVLVIVFTMMSATVKAAIYHYATTGEAPEGFEQEIIRASFTPAKARGVFGS